MALYSCKNNSKNGLFCTRECCLVSAMFQIVWGAVVVSHLSSCTAELHRDEDLSPVTGKVM